MNISVLTNRPEFLNDLAEEVRLFYGAAEVTGEPCEEYDLRVDVNLASDENHAHGITRISNADGNVLSEYTYSTDAVSGTELEIKRYTKRILKISVFRALKQMEPTAHTPWGSLTGIRPTRLLRELETTHGLEKAREIFTNEFDVSDEKYALAREINAVQTPFISDSDRDADIYIGIPYCKTRCLYCSFLSGLRTKSTDMRRYIDALKRDISHGAQTLRKNGFRAQHLYMGGGTPTVLTADELYEVLSHALTEYGMTSGEHEITVEAGRPDTIDREKLTVLRDLHVSRISINPQSMNKKTLEVIGRAHSPEEIEECFMMARELGFVINMDMITCLPGEDAQDVEHTLERILALRPENLTVHTLALKRSSLLVRTLDEYPLPDPDTANSMLDVSQKYAKAHGLRPYYMYRQKYMRGNLENVGYSLPGYECAYNIDMMEETRSIMAHGAGAMTKRIYPGQDVRVERLPNPKDVETYINKLDQLFRSKEKLFS